MEEIRQEQLRNMQMKERRPQRLAPLHQRDNNNGDEIGEGLQQIERPAYADDQIQDVIDEMGPSRVAEMPLDENQRDPSPMVEAQDEAQPSSSALEQAE